MGGGPSLKTLSSGGTYWLLAHVSLQQKLFWRLIEIVWEERKNTARFPKDWRSLARLQDPQIFQGMSVPRPSTRLALVVLGQKANCN